MVGQDPPHRLEESDIGSGDKPPGQQDTEKLIDQLNKAPPGKQSDRQQEQGGSQPADPGRQAS